MWEFIEIEDVEFENSIFTIKFSLLKLKTLLRYHGYTSTIGNSLSPIECRLHQNFTKLDFNNVDC